MSEDAHQEEVDGNKVDFELLTRRCSSATASTTRSNTPSEVDQSIWPLHLTPNFIRHYIIGESIGSGSYAEVRECVDTRSLERLAMKIVNKDFLRRQAPRALANQMQEIKLLRRLHHPNIVVMRESLFIGSYLYIALEYCAFNLSDILADQPHSKLEPTLSRDFFHQLCSGVSYIHSLGIIHRDIKPQNLLINNNGILKLIDFGVSQILSVWAPEAKCSNYEGSPLFQAPEVVAGQSEYDGTKADVWSCGVTLYLMLYGEYPFMDEALLGLYDKILGQEYTLPMGIVTQSSLIDLFAAALDKNYKRRATIDEILTHPWLKLHHAAGVSDDDEGESEFIDFVLSSKLERANANDDPTKGNKNQTSDVYKSMSVLPYLYKYHFPKLPVGKQFKHQNDSRSMRNASSNEHKIFSTSSSAERSDNQQPSSADAANETDQDEQVEWGTRAQYDLMKVPQVRANRLKTTKSTHRCGRRQRKSRRRQDESNEQSRKSRRIQRHPKPPRAAHD